MLSKQNYICQAELAVNAPSVIRHNCIFTSKILIKKFFHLILTSYNNNYRALIKLLVRNTMRAMSLWWVMLRTLKDHLACCRKLLWRIWYLLIEVNRIYSGSILAWLENGHHVNRLWCQSAVPPFKKSASCDIYSMLCNICQILFTLKHYLLDS